METRIKSKCKKEKQICFKLTEKQLNLIVKMSNKHELNRSEFIRYHFMNLLNSYENGE